MKKITLKELGNNIPIPLPDSKDTTFDFLSWGLKEEKEIGELKRKSQFMGPFINEVLAKMIVRCAGVDFASMNHQQRILFLYKMPMMDILYMWIYLRYDQLDEMIRLNVGCPGCGRMNDNFEANLEGLDVECVEDGDNPLADYKLRKPFKLEEEDADNIKVLKVKRTPWGAMDKADDEVTTNQGLIMDLMFRHSIVGWDDEEGYLDFDKLTNGLRKRDFERLSTVIQKHNAGPTLALEGKCNFCPTKFYRQLDWSYDNFFGSSSLPID